MAEIIIWTTLAGLAMPLGGLLACMEKMQPRWLEEELRHAVIAFGGGILLAAISLVLVPQGILHLSPWTVASAMLLGGIAFLFLDEFLTRSKTPASQLVAMLSDFIPEAMALGAAFISMHSIGLLLALLIGLQNVPEGFNAYRELMKSGRFSSRRIILAFTALAAAGPIAGILGWFFLTDRPLLLHFIMLFAAGGILYLIFQEIAPQAR
ncbi:MAG: divalent cation transporter, partial [Planctomycetes bacterium]|nr:divalent cation transporter [Planctomycetota bacterium]